MQDGLLEHRDRLTMLDRQRPPLTDGCGAYVVRRVASLGLPSRSACFGARLGRMATGGGPLRLLGWIGAVFALTVLAASCATESGSRDQSPSATTATAGTAPDTTASAAVELLSVDQVTFQPVSFEHWQDGASLIDSGYIWGAVITNPSQRTAVDVQIVVSFKRGGTVMQERTYVVDAVPPGELAWGSSPLIVNDAKGTPTSVDAVEATLSPLAWESTTPTDRLLSPDVVTLAEWKGELKVQVVPEHRVLVAMVAYFDPDGRLLAVDPNRLDPAAVRSSADTPAVVAARPDGNVGPTGDVRVFLTRMSNPAQVLPAPLAATAASVSVARERWRAHGARAYTWRVTRTCYCAGATLDIGVEAGAVTNVAVVDPGRQDSYSHEAAQEDALTIDDLFNHIETAIRNGDAVFATFDADLGYPTSATLTSKLPDGGDTFDTIDFQPTGPAYGSTPPPSP
jgi:hypothetical protein